AGWEPEGLFGEMVSKSELEESLVRVRLPCRLLERHLLSKLKQTPAIHEADEPNVVIDETPPKPSAPPKGKSGRPKQNEAVVTAAIEARKEDPQPTWQEIIDRLQK